MFSGMYLSGFSQDVKEGGFLERKAVCFFKSRGNDLIKTWVEK